MTKELNLDAMDKLIKMKREDPEGYKKYLEELTEVTKDLAKVNFALVKAMKDELGGLF